MLEVNEDTKNKEVLFFSLKVICSMKMTHYILKPDEFIPTVKCHLQL